MRLPQSAPTGANYNHPQENGAKPPHNLEWVPVVGEGAYGFYNAMAHVYLLMVAEVYDPEKSPVDLLEDEIKYLWEPILAHVHHYFDDYDSDRLKLPRSVRQLERDRVNGVEPLDLPGEDLQESIRKMGHALRRLVQEMLENARPQRRL